MLPSVTEAYCALLNTSSGI